MPRASTEILRSLSERLARASRRDRSKTAVVSSGCLAMDRLLPEDGLLRGSLVEWLGAGPGSGASSLALALAWRACQPEGMLAVVDQRRWFYPPAVFAWGIPAERLLIARPRNARDLAWSMDQILRSPSIDAVVAWPDKISDHTFRRWQLAAESGGVIGMLARPASARASPSWADSRWLVTPAPSRASEETPEHAMSRRALRLTLLRRRGGGARVGAEAEQIYLELDALRGHLHETSPLSLASVGRRQA